MADARPRLHALTLWQPWASAIAHGPKRAENRTWRPPAWLIGGPLAIHAGSQYSAVDEEALAARGVELHRELPRSAVIALARVTGAIAPDDGLRGGAWHEAGYWGWVLDNVTAIEPVPCRGWQRLWSLPPEVERTVWERVAAARERAEGAHP